MRFDRYDYWNWSTIDWINWAKKAVDQCPQYNKK